MKKQLLYILLSLLAVNTSAQITIIDSDLVDVGDVIYQATDVNPSSMIGPGNSGATQWDFSALQANETDTIEFISPIGTPFSSSHPSANLCFLGDQTTYIDKNSFGATIVGVDDLPVFYPLLPLPLTYPYSSTIGPSITEEVFANIFFPDSLSLFITMAQAHTIDSIKYTDEVQTDFSVDAYGSVTIPSGTYDALRLYVNQIQTLSAFVYCTDTLFGTGSGWYPIPSQLLPSGLSLGTDTIRSYQWWTNDNSIKFALVQMSVDLTGNIEMVDFLLQPSATQVQNTYVDDVSVFPVPSTELLNINITSSDQCTLSLMDTHGHILLEESFSNTNKINTSSYAPGIYVLKLTMQEKIIVRRIIIE